MVSLVNVPGFVVNPTVNCLALDIPATENNLLNPEFFVAAVLLVLLTFINSTWDPTLRLWGSSVVIVAVFDAHDASATNLKFLCSFLFDKSPVPK